MSIALRSSSSARQGAADTDNLAALRSLLDGELVTPDHPQCDERRQVHDLLVDRRPLALVRARHAEDVAVTVRFAREHAMPLTIRAGSHSLARHSMIDGAIVVDLGCMKRITVDPVSRIARVQAGATTGDLIGVASEFDLALSTGDTASVGMGGLITGGGIGFMVRKYGLTIDSLISARVVTADGEIVTASATEHPHLFWAIRGGGSNFGIITEYELRLAPVGQVIGGMLLLPATRAAVRAYLDYTAAASDDLTTIANIMHAPPAPFVPEDRVGELVLSVLVCWTGAPEAADEALAPLRALGDPLADTIGPMPYAHLYRYTEHQTMRHCWSMRSMYANELSDRSLDAMLTAMEQASSPYSIVHLRGLGGAMARVSPDETAFSHRDTRYLVAAIGVWLDPTEDAVMHQTWVHGLWQQIRQDEAGVYVNFLENEGTDRTRAAYSRATFERLAAVKQAYDPRNLFQFNQNVPARRL